MKLNNFYVTLFILSVLLQSCGIDTISISPNNTITYRDVDISNYSAIEIANDFNAYVTFSESEEAIVIEANENLHKLIVVTKNNNKLIVRLKDNVRIKGKETLNVYIKATTITDFTALADSNIYIENTLIEDHVKIKVSADSHFSGKVNINHLNAKVEADSYIDLDGNINTVDAKLSADAELSGYNLNVKDLKINMSADCNASLTVTGSIHIDAVADCILRYKGNPIIVHKNLRADSRIKKVD